MLFHIAPEISQVECHLTWIEQLLPYIERTWKDRSDTMEDHIKLLLRKPDDQDDNDGDVAYVTDEEFEDGYNEQNPKYCSVYASRLNEATKLAYLSEFQEASKQLELLDRIYDKVEECHRAAYQYAVDAMKWSIKIMQAWKRENEPESNGPDDVVDAVEDPVIFQIRWEQLQEDNKTKAALKSLWGALGGALKINEECINLIHQEVLSLDPDYHVWYSLAYQSTRGVRRNAHRQQSGGLLRGPTEMEELMCKEAYERQPNIYLSIKDMAIMIKEKLWTSGEGQGAEQAWDRQEETYLRCKNLFEEALRIATERNQKKWTRKLQVYLAEFLLFGRGRKLDQDEGKRLFDVCLSENPTDSTVLHKVGKLCHYGAANRPPSRFRKFCNWDLAELSYQQSLLAKPSNYPCVKDYLKLLRAREKYKQYLEVLDTVIPKMKRDYQVADLTILRGCIVWIFDPYGEYPQNRENACKSWLHVVEKLPDYVDCVYSTLKKPPFFRGTKPNTKPAYINAHQLSNTLERVKKRCSKTEKEKLNAIGVLLKHLQTVAPPNNNN